MYTDDICKLLEKAELSQKMAFLNAADFDMAAFPLKPELKFIWDWTLQPWTGVWLCVLKPVLDRTALGDAV